VHAFRECDTTSTLHGIGKGVALKKLTTDVLFYQQAEAFNRPSATKEEIVLVGEKALLSFCTIANCLIKALIYCGTLDFVRELQQGQPLYRPKASSNVGSCRVSQPESVLPNTTVP